jgi:uncharacterized phage-associated protein
MAYDAKVVANYFLELAEQDQVPIGPLKLQKLVYLAHGWHLAFFGKPLIKNEVEAWRYGPVVPSLYREFKEFGGSTITRRARGWDTDALKADADARRLIDTVWSKYGKLSAAQLSTLTHEPGSAWYMTLRNSSPFDRLTIVDALIADEFQRRRRADGRSAY